MAWLYVPVDTDLKRDCILFCQEPIAPYVLLKGKPSPLPVSHPQWKTRPWKRFLSGMTLPHSILSLGVDSYISSLRDTPASRSVSLENALEKMTRAISGLTSSGIYALLNPSGCGAKMLQLTLKTDSPLFDQHLSISDTESRQESLRLHTLARRIKENACFSSHSFPTPAAAQARQGQNDANGRRGQTLIGAARGQNWPTIKATDGTHGGPNQRGSKGDLALPAAVQDWATPTGAAGTGGQTSRGRQRKEELLLAGQAAWATPKASMNGPDYARSKRKGSGTDDLVTQTAKNWGTPSAHDCKGKGMDGQLTTDIFHGRGQQDAEKTNTPGKLPGSLNPAWVEQLMGWASGMSNFTCSETEWCRWLRQWRLWLFGKE